MKTCVTCNETKPLYDFYRHRKMRDGRLNSCSACEVERSVMRQRQRRAAELARTFPPGLTFDAIPTMAHPEFVRWVASRYGAVNPSPDDILNARWPHYGTGDSIHIKGYHADFSEAIRVAMKAVTVRKCKACAAEIVADDTNRRYCGDQCRDAAAKKRARGVGKGATRFLTRMTAKEKAEIVRLYMAGNSQLQTGAICKRSQGAVQRVLKEAGIDASNRYPMSEEAA